MTDTIEQVLSRWTDAEEIRLRAGEIDSDTMRDILVVTQAMGRQVRDACDAKIQELEGKIEQLRADKTELVDALEWFRRDCIAIISGKPAKDHAECVVFVDTVVGKATGEYDDES